MKRIAILSLLAGALLALSGCKSEKVVPSVDGTAYPEVERWWK